MRYSEQIQLRKKKIRADLDRRIDFPDSWLEGEELTIKRNITIAKETEDTIRDMFAIWRLYQYNNLPIWLIAERIDRNEGTVQRIIGQVFKALCLTDDKCVFKKLLAVESNRESKGRIACRVSCKKTKEV